jgi:hypothetical protein
MIEKKQFDITKVKNFKKLPIFIQNSTVFNINDELNKVKKIAKFIEYEQHDDEINHFFKSITRVL